MPDFHPPAEPDAHWSVDVTLPSDVEQIITERQRRDDGEVWTTIIHAALWETRTRTMSEVELRMDFKADLYPAIQEMERGEGTLVTEQWKRESLQCFKEHWERMQEIPHGNLLLPEKLYLFVFELVDGGVFTSTSDAVAAAVRSPHDTAEKVLSCRQAR